MKEVTIYYNHGGEETILTPEGAAFHAAEGSFQIVSPEKTVLIPLAELHKVEIAEAQE